MELADNLANIVEEQHKKNGWDPIFAGCGRRPSRKEILMEDAYEKAAIACDELQKAERNVNEYHNPEVRKRGKEREEVGEGMSGGKG